MTNKFKDGDWVIALTSNNNPLSPRIQGDKYKVLATANCNNCNEQLIMIDKKELPRSYKIKCNACGCSDLRSNHPWTMASNFTSADTANPVDIEKRLKHAIASENYELAAQLRDQLNLKN